MSNEQATPKTNGVTAEVLATVDLGPEIEGMAGRQLRMRMVTIEPGGVFGPIHDHNDRPGIVYILQGTITDHRMKSLRTMDREWAGPRIGTPHTGLRTEERFRRWRSRST
jgi:quercetin dioxygenase-like cupin family protein